MPAEELKSNSPDSSSLLKRAVECVFFCGKSERDTEWCGLQIVEPISSGGFGSVLKCFDYSSEQFVAVKVIPILNICEGVPSSIIREVSLLQELNHVNIVKLLKVTGTNKHVNLLFECLDCDLQQYIVDPCCSPKDSRTTKSFLHQILSAVAFCHVHKILHRDIKPSNLLIDRSKNIIKLADFGLARELGDPDMLYTKEVATWWYRAPEILFEAGKYSAPVDLWSVGCVFGEMVTGKPVFQALNCKDELEAIFKLLGTPTEEMWPGVTRLCKHLHTYAKFNPMDLSKVFPDLDQHGLSLLSRMLCLDPNRRISAEAALEHPYFKDLKLDSEGKVKF